MREANSVLDIAALVLERAGFVPTMKLQKLVYYSQALHLARHGEPLFSEAIEAWSNGPVAPALFQAQRRKFVVGPHEIPDADATSVTEEGRRVVDRVVARLGQLTGVQLSELARSERPWIDARGALPADARRGGVISAESMAAYYGSPGCENPLFSTGKLV